MHSWRLRILMLAAVFMLASAALIVLGVIPPVRADASAGATSERAVYAFWANVVFALLVGMSAVVAARLGPSRVTLRRVVAAAAGVVAVVLGLLLIDAAAAYAGHGPGMHGAVVVLRVCVCLDFTGGMAMIASSIGPRGV